MAFLQCVSILVHDKFAVGCKHFITFRTLKAAFQCELSCV
ncbi:unnamed protein product [Staurois parvus]|uniref:Uncharacterized protein n=1 Tax=Staurois parvus TaxID=386267 RepID=A0ABN9AA56_9NEOB|nr:unnamed protein product [Staurois parvus]